MAPSIRTELSAAGLTEQDLCREIRKECEADIVIGIPTFNNARTIGHVLRAVQTGLLRCFPDQKAVIVISDGGSRDGTVAIVRNSVVRGIPVYIARHRSEPVQAAVPHCRMPGRAAAFRSIFLTAVELDVRACLVLEADITNVTPTWIEALTKPIIHGNLDFVSPLHSRHRFENTMTNTLLYPLTRAVYGKRIRQPLGANFGISPRLARFYMDGVLERPDCAHAGIELRLLTEAIANDYKIAQVFLCTKISEQLPKADVNDVLPQLAGSVFSFIQSDYVHWKTVRGSEAIPLMGAPVPIKEDEVRPDVERMLALFRQGVRDLKGLWISILGAPDFGVLEYLAFRPESRFAITSTLWAQIVYDYALAYHEKKLSVGHLLRSFTPLYLGKAASHLLEILDKGEQDAEDEVEKICIAFEEGKDRLVRNWKN